MPAPTPAASAGYFTNTYSSTIYSSSTVDEGLTNIDGFQWYFANFFGYTPPNNAGVTFNMDGTMSVASQPDSGMLLSTVALSGGAYVGTTFSNGAYFEAELKYDPATVSSMSGWPKFGLRAVERLAGLAGEQWSGQAAGYLHFFEAEIMDAFLASTSQYRGLLHDRYGTGGSSSVDGVQTFNFGSVNFNISHKYGLLWVPATPSAQGFFKFYFDGTQVGSTVLYSQFTTQTPPPTTGTFWTYGIADYQSLVMTLESGTGSPLTVISVNVWQNTGVPFDAVEVSKVDALPVLTTSPSVVVSKETGMVVVEPSFVATAKYDGLAVVNVGSNLTVSKETGMVVVEPNHVGVSKIDALAIIEPPTNQQEVFKLTGMVVVSPIKPLPIEFTTFTPPTSDPAQPLVEPTGETAVDFSARVLEGGFGNDYVLTAIDGLNTVIGVYTVVFDGLSLQVLEDIEQFFSDRNGFIPFIYTIPGESTPKVFKCKTWTRTQVGPSWKLTCEFRQTFDLS